MGLFRLLFRSSVRTPRHTDGRSSRATTVETVTETTVVVRRAPSPPPSPATARTLTTLTGHAYVVDGDTIIINKTRIRIAGIDAPELDHPWGRNAKWAVVALCKGQQVTAHLDGALSHDRVVATCYLPDGRDIAMELVKQGLAIDWPKYSGGKYRAYEVDGVRKRLWRAHQRQLGRFPPRD